MRDAIAGYDRAGAVCPALAVNEDGLIFRRVDDCHDALYLLVARAAQTVKGDIEIAQSGSTRLLFFKLGIFISVTKVDDGLDAERSQFLKPALFGLCAAINCRVDAMKVWQLFILRLILRTNRPGHDKKCEHGRDES